MIRHNRFRPAIVRVLCCILPALAALSAGCATGKHMAPINADLGTSGLLNEQQRAQLQKSLTDSDIANLLDVDVKTKLPTYLAVAKVTRLGHYYGREGSAPGDLSLEMISSSDLAGWQDTLGRQYDIRGVRAVSPVSQDQYGISIHSLRTLAARMDCELLLVYLQADGSVDNYNASAALYWTFVGLWVAPGNTYERRTMMQAALVDCRTGMILGTASGQGQAKTDYAAAYGQIAQDRLDRQTPPMALADLQRNSLRMITQTLDATKGTPQ
jgi:hypothetical protein